MTKLTTVFALSLSLCIGLFAQETEVPVDQEEAPDTIFSTQLGENDVDLFLQGSWVTLISLGVGGEWGDFDTGFDNAYPGVTRGFLFSQAPQLLFSLTLDDRYYTQIDYRGDVLASRFALGYDGEEGELLQAIRGGNLSNTIRPSASLDGIFSPAGTPSLSVRFGDDPWFADLLIRYRENSDLVKTFRGESEVTLTILELDAYLPGRFFRIPGAPTEISVLVEDPEGNVLRDDSAQSFRFATPSEYRYLSGVLEILEDLDGSWWVGYNGIADYTHPVSALLYSTQGFSDGENYLPLRGSGNFGPLELRNRYPLIGGESPTINLVEKGSLKIESAPPGTVVLSSGGDFFVYQGEGADQDFPFLEDYPEIYTSPTTSTALFNWEFALEERQTEGDFYLGSGIIPESIRVSISGRRISGFTWDEAFDRVLIHEAFFPDDLIEISYQVEEAASFDSNEVGIYHTGAWTLDDEHNFGWGIRGGWSISDQGFSNYPSQHPGGLGALGTYAFTNGPWEIKIGGNLQLDLQDTTGLLAADSLGSQDRFLVWDFSYLLPSPLPGDTQGLPDLVDWDFGSTLTNNSRGDLIFRQFQDTDAFGNRFLQTYQWSEALAEEYTEGNRSGPYLARGDEEVNEILLGMEFSLDPGKNWVGAQGFLFSKEDLSQTRRIKLQVQNESADESQLRAFLMIGSLSEDLQGDGSLLEVDNELPIGLRFQDPDFANPVVIPRYPGDPGNDQNQDGRITSDAPGSVLFREFSLPSTGTGWNTQILELTQEERERLTASRGVRILLVTSGLSSQSGRIWFSPLEMIGGNFSSSGSLFASPVTESEISPEPTSELEELFLDEEKTSIDSDALEIRWTEDDWSLRRSLDPIPKDAYQRARIHYYLPTTTTPVDLVFRLLGSGGTSLEAQWNTSATTGWERLIIDLEDNLWEAEGQSGSLTGKIDGPILGWEISGSGSSSGTIYIDELQFTDPSIDMAFGGNSSTTYTMESPFLVGGLVVLDSLKLIWYQEKNLKEPWDHLLQIQSTSGPLSLDWTSQLEYLTELDHSHEYRLGWTDGWGSLESSFGTQGSSNHSLSFSGDPYLLELEAGYLRQGASASSKWSFTGSGNLGPMSFSTQSSIDQFGQDPLVNQSSGDLWLGSFSLFHPDFFDQSSRFDWQANLGTSWDLGLLSIDLNSESGVDSDNSSLDTIVYHWKNTLSTLALNTKETIPNWLVTLVYTREARSNQSGAQGKFLPAWQAWWDFSSVDSGFSRSALFFWPEAPEEDPQGSWDILQNYQGIWSRRSTLSWWDWVIPYSLSGTLQQSWKGEQGVWEGDWQANILSNWYAFSLLGSQGVYRFEGLFLREEYQGFLDLSYTQSGELLQWRWGQDWLFFFPNNWQIGLDFFQEGTILGCQSLGNSLSFTLEQEIKEEIDWIYFPGEPRRTDKLIYRAELDLVWENESITPVDLFFQADVQLLLGNSGKARAYLKSGLQYLEPQNFWGLEAGLELSLFF